MKKQHHGLIFIKKVLEMQKVIIMKMLKKKKLKFKILLKKKLNY